MNHYAPKPIDTSSVVLSPELLRLAELLAANTHDIWAAGRLRQGWSYGPVRDDLKKTTPCLVPYDELPESEKLFDRETAMGTIKVLLRLGYQITKSPNRII